MNIDITRIPEHNDVDKKKKNWNTNHTPRNFVALVISLFLTPRTPPRFYPERSIFVFSTSLPNLFYPLSLPPVLPPVTRPGFATFFVFFFLFLLFFLPPTARFEEFPRNENRKSASPWRRAAQRRVRSCRSSALIWAADETTELRKKRVGH